MNRRKRKDLRKRGREKEAFHGLGTRIAKSK